MNNLELELWQRIAGLQQSVSHDFHHIRRVQRYAEELRKVYGGDPEVLIAACILHDLGRGDQTRRHGLESIEASKEFAAATLRFTDLSPEKKETILRAIDTHDQPDLRPELLEARILKDADFLAGFGAWGILRIAMWSGETGRRVEEVLEKLGDGMRRRFESLEFELSREIARRELLVAKLFSAELSSDTPTPIYTPPGVYVVLEGISGSGKNTVAAQVKEVFAKRGVDSVLVEEPSENFRNIRTILVDNRADLSDPQLAKACFIADRNVLVENTIKPALDKGGLVVSVRSHLSTAVYQSDGSDSEAYSIMLAHSWVPACDLLIVLDLDVQNALMRISQREKTPGDFEAEEDLKRHRELYLRYAPLFNARNYRLIDARRSKDVVAGDVIAAIQECCAGKLGISKS